MSESGRLKTWKRVRQILVIVGVSVWAPYALIKYGLGRTFPVGYVLALHIPCMVGALTIRILEAKWKRAGKEEKT